MTPSRPWLVAGFYTLALVACLGVFRDKAFRDPGALWHIRVGEIILADGFPRTDPFTYTHEGKPWTPQQWLAEVGMAAVYKVRGFDGLLVLLCAGVAALHAIVFVRLLDAGLTPMLAGLLTAALLFVGSFHYYARPHMATVAGMGLTVALLVDVDRGRRSPRWLWLLPPLYVLWANLHGGMLGGLLTVGLAAGGWLVSRHPARWTAVGVTLVCGLAPLVNPFGLDLLRTWFSIVGSKVLKEAVSEHHPLSLAVPADRLVVLVAVGYAVAVMRYWRATRWTWVVPAVWFGLALTGIRHGPLFVIAAAMLLPDVLRRAGSVNPLRGCPGKEVVTDPGSPSGGLHPPLACAALTLALFLTLRGVTRLDPDTHPVAFEPRLRAWDVITGPDGRLYNDANFGGYLLHTLPTRRIFMDDRFEQYGDDWTRQYVECIWRRPEAFDEWDRRWQFGLALVATDPAGPTPLDAYLTRHPAWLEVGRLPHAVLFQKR